MPRLTITNTSDKMIKRANKTFKPGQTKETYIRDGKIPIIDACKSLEWEYADPLMELDFDNITSYTSLELKEFAQKAGVKNYSKLLKDDLIHELKVKKGLIEPEKEEEEEEEEEWVEESEEDEDNS